LPSSSLTLPKWGMMRNGVLWERTTPEHLTSETESGSSQTWPTPTRMDSVNSMIETREQWEERNARKKAENANLGGVQKSLRSVVHWPTPNQRDWKDTGATQGNRKSPNLGTMVHQSFATPQARDFRTGQQSRWENAERTRNLNDQIGGQMTPLNYPTPNARDWKGKPGPNANQRDSSLPTAVGEDVKTVGKLNPTWVEWLMGWPLGWTDCAASATDKFQQWQTSHSTY